MKWNYLGANPVRSNLIPSTDVCGISTQDRIYGGEKTDLDEFPWMALIEYEKRMFVICDFYVVG